MRAGAPALHAAWSALRPGQHLLTVSFKVHIPKAPDIIFVPRLCTSHFF